MPNIKIKRAYEPPAPGDGVRVLVDRLWPRGLSRQDAQIDVWLPDIAPSTELRRFYGHKPDRWPEFRRRYKAELRASKPAITALRLSARKEGFTLVFAAKDELRNNAAVLKEVLSPSKPARRPVPPSTRRSPARAARAPKRT